MVTGLPSKERGNPRPLFSPFTRLKVETIHTVLLLSSLLLGTTMFSKLFRKCTDESNTLPSSNRLQQTLEMLEEKENVLQKKISIEVGRAKEFSRAKNRQAALQCLKRKKFYEGQMEHLGNFQLHIHTQEEKLLQKMPTHGGQVERVSSNVKKTSAKETQLEMEHSCNYSGALVPYK